jgi:hypothetical protein
MVKEKADLTLGGIVAIDDVEKGHKVHQRHVGMNELDVSTQEGILQ